MNQIPQPRPAVAGLPAYVAGRKASGADVAALASNESHFEPLPSVVAAINAAAARTNRYPDMASAGLRDWLAADLKLATSAFAFGPGSVGVLGQLIAAFCDPGDEVVFAWRSFEAYPILCQIANAVPVKVPLTLDERHDLPAMLAAITERTKVVILCSPNNPTGTTIGHAELDDFLAHVPSRVLVVLDEAYREFAGEQAADGLALLGTKYANLALLRTFSKAYGLAGLRVGYAIAHEPIAEGLRKTQIPFSVSRVAEAAAMASLAASDELRARVARVVTERDRLLAGVRELGWASPDTGANFVWLRCDDPTRERLVAAFDAADILVRGYPGDGVRISIADATSTDRVLAVLAGFNR